MDFSTVELSPEDTEFRDRLRAFLVDVVTDEVIRRDRETGENFDEGVHLALGAEGYLAADWNDVPDGGFSALRRRIWDLEIGRAHTPWFHWGTTAVVAKMVRQFGPPELTDEVLPGVLAGDTRLCLGYTEPEGGSDVATCKTRAVREADGSSWVINGSKMFTSNAHNAKYVFLLTNTDPDAPKHKNLTMFLVPLDTPGVDIQGIRTVDGDRTNIVYYSDVRVDDRYRIGAVNGGWGVLRGALDEEHGTAEKENDGLQRVAVMSEHLTLMAEAIDRIARIGHAAECRWAPPDRRRLGGISVGPRRCSHRSGAEHAGDVRPGGQRADHARRRARPDGHPGHRLGAPGRHRGGRRRSRQWRRGVHFPTGLTCRYLRRHPRGVPQHDRPARAGARAPELLAAEPTWLKLVRGSAWVYDR